MSNPWIESVERANAFARANLSACCAELIEWGITGVLVDGKMRELAALTRLYSNEYECLRVAEDMIEKLAIKYVVGNPPK